MNITKKTIVRLIISVFSLIFVLLFAFFIFRFSPKPASVQELPGKIRVGAGVSIAYVSLYGAQETALFEQQGIDVEINTSLGNSGFGILTALDEGLVDIALAGTYPLAYKILMDEQFNHRDMVILATYLTSYIGIKVLVRNDAQIYSGEDLKGKRIAIYADSQLKYFFDSILVNYKILPREVTILNTPFGSEIDVIKNDKADVVVTVEPYITDMLDEFNEQVSFLEVDRGVRTTLNLFTTREYAENNKEYILAFLRAIEKSSEFLESKSIDSLKIISDFLSVPEQEALNIISDINLGLMLDQALLVSLENESRWILKQEDLPELIVPNYLPYIETEFLRAVKPEAVSIVSEKK